MVLFSFKSYYDKTHRAATDINAILMIPKSNMYFMNKNNRNKLAIANEKREKYQIREITMTIHNVMDSEAIIEKSD